MPWLSLGSLAPKLNVWRAYSSASPLASGEAVFRVTPKNLGVGVIFKSYALVRFSTIQEGKTIVTPARRVYPRAETMVIEADIPREVRGGGQQWRPEVQKRIYRNFRGRSPEPAYLIEIEHLVRAEVPFELGSDSNTSPFWDREDITMDITNAAGLN
ncbi:MAG: hypothetical protein DCF17_21095 [Shackletoniella antarctica]|uniref:Uncharacterized protein n=1 Tax=Shackletoniella antarctica TaxID=268115 RepID=A0A2W4XHE4_9CYAN|nr:MAG: hypothetical protein DCF17_21095 [Shackletoniella antarctica]